MTMGSLRYLWSVAMPTQAPFDGSTDCDTMYDDHPGWVVMRSEMPEWRRWLEH